MTDDNYEHCQHWRICSDCVGFDEAESYAAEIGRLLAELAAATERAEKAERVAELRAEAIRDMNGRLARLAERAERAERERDEARDLVVARFVDIESLRAESDSYRADADRFIGRAMKAERERDRLREAMPSEEERASFRSVVRYVGKSGAADHVCDDADAIMGWLARLDAVRNSEVT